MWWTRGTPKGDGDAGTENLVEVYIRRGGRGERRKAMETQGPSKANGNVHARGGRGERRKAMETAQRHINLLQETCRGGSGEGRKAMETKLTRVRRTMGFRQV